MKYLHVKNYRLLKDNEFIMGLTNFFVGENNIGKTSILKLIESICKINNIFLEETSRNETISTYLGDNTIFNLFYDSSIPLEILFASWQYEKDNNKEVDVKEKNKLESRTPVFEYFKINGFANTGIPIISELVTIDLDNSILCHFKIEY